MSGSASKNLYGSPKVGGEILAYCTKCKLELGHTIVSMVESTPSKVKCNTCQGNHKFKRQTMATLRKKVAARGKAAPKSKVPAVDLWQEKLKNRHEGEAKSYKANVTFTKDDVIQHVKFGLGVVDEVKSNGKITVFFQEGEKILIHAR